MYTQSTRQRLFVEHLVQTVTRYRSVGWRSVAGLRTLWQQPSHHPSQLHSEETTTNTWSWRWTVRPLSSAGLDCYKCHKPTGCLHHPQQDPREKWNARLLILFLQTDTGSYRRYQTRWYSCCMSRKQWTRHSHWCSELDHLVFCSPRLPNVNTKLSSGAEDLDPVVVPVSNDDSVSAIYRYTSWATKLTSGLTPTAKTSYYVSRVLCSTPESCGCYSQPRRYPPHWWTQQHLVHQNSPGLLPWWPSVLLHWPVMLVIRMQSLLLSVTTISLSLITATPQGPTCVPPRSPQITREQSREFCSLHLFDARLAT